MARVPGVEWSSGGEAGTQEQTFSHVSHPFGDWDATVRPQTPTPLSQLLLLPLIMFILSLLFIIIRDAFTVVVMPLQYSP